MNAKYESLKLKIPTWYKQGLWSADMVQKAVDKGILTEDEAKQVLQEDM